MADPNNTNTSRTDASSPSGKQPNPPSSPPPAPAAKPTRHAIQGPKGTRDLYPDDANIRRFITEAWRNTSIRHGFEEVDGPTFEDAALYKVKSGEGILAEMFGVYSGKSDEDRRAVQADPENPPYALRPEFTPTLARMYAARAAQLPKPTKWFTAGPFFRAERPQRGRLREFLQWNVDFIGLGVAQVSDLSSGAARADAVAQVSNLGSGAARASNPQPSDPLAEARARADAECIACCIDLLRSLEIECHQVKVRVSDRGVHEALLRHSGVSAQDVPAVRAFLDERSKLSAAERTLRESSLGFRFHSYSQSAEWMRNDILARVGRPVSSVGGSSTGQGTAAEELTFDYTPLVRLMECAKHMDIEEWIEIDLSIVRGLAYYTGMVFEVIADGERAVAGGGRYDNLIELFGGPPTPAVGFGMGDVVLTNLLRDKGLLPAGQTLLDKLSQPPASLRPDAFVLTADETLDPKVRELVATLRRGDTDGTSPLHARHPYKSTRNVGKLLKDAAAQHARFAVIIENPRDATIKDMTTGRQHWCPIDSVPAWLRSALRP